MNIIGGSPQVTFLGKGSASVKISSQSNPYFTTEDEMAVLMDNYNMPGPVSPLGIRLNAGATADFTHQFSAVLAGTGTGFRCIYPHIQCTTKAWVTMQLADREWCRMLTDCPDDTSGYIDLQMEEGIGLRRTNSDARAFGTVGLVSAA